MALTVGSRLGPYEIAAALGGGGMGEVYRARDPRLGRDVAIKVLPGEVAKHEERLARFKREAQLLAALNHPNIAAIHGLDEAEGQMFLVLELVDGEDLAERLKRGAIPVDESIAIARQIGEALEEAHEKGIVHRDLKPANIKLTLDGKVKVLDFGLAKAYASEGSGGGSSPEISHSPTMTHRGTEPGMILGTAAYMSPEQARGKAVDKRADIWSFGVVLYEMLTGQRLFAGETVSDVLASVLKQDIDWSRVPVGAPRELRRLLARCLDRDPRNRLHDIADARIALEEARHGEPDSRAAAPEGRPRPRWLAALPWSVAGLALLMAAAFGLRGGGERPSGPRPLTVFGVLMPEQHFLPLSDAPILDLSGDGRTLLFVGEGQRPPAIFRRPLASMSVSRVEGTEDAEHPALSRDGRWIAFFARGALRKVPVEGGSPIVVAEAPAPRGLSWTPEGGLVFSPRYNSPLFRVAAAGGPPVEVTTLDTTEGERTHRWPQVLPDGRTVMFTVGLASSPGDYDGSRIEAQSLDTGARRTVVRGARMARYAAAGYLVYQRGSTLVAVRFDARRGEATGEPFTIHQGVAGDASSGAGYFTVSDAGAVALAPETSIPKDRALVLVDAAGRETALNLPPAPFNHPRFSPDGRRITLAIGTGNAGTDDVYIVDLASQRMQRLTFDQGHGAPLWSPDGRRILYTNGRSGEIGLQMRAADGSGDAVTIARGSELLLADAWLPDGRRVAATTASGSIDIQVVDTQAGGQLTPLFANPSFGESAAAVSPDGRYVAYASTETGANEIIVETLPPGRGKWQVSVAGGVNPAWSRGGRSLYFASVDGLMAVDVDTREGFHPGRPRVLFAGPYELRTPIQRNYDVGPDGRFVVVKRQVTSRTPQQLLMLDGWEVADPARAGGR